MSGDIHSIDYAYGRVLPGIANGAHNIMISSSPLATDGGNVP